MVGPLCIRLMGKGRQAAYSLHQLLVKFYMTWHAAMYLLRKTNSGVAARHSGRYLANWQGTSAKRPGGAGGGEGREGKRRALRACRVIHRCANLPSSGYASRQPVVSSPGCSFIHHWHGAWLRAPDVLVVLQHGAVSEGGRAAGVV